VSACQAKIIISKNSTNIPIGAKASLCFCTGPGIPAGAALSDVKKKIPISATISTTNHGLWNFSSQSGRKPESASDTAR